MDEAGLVITRHKLTADEYHRMAENGILDEDDQVELIAGQIIDMAPMGVRHTAVVRRINHALTAACADRALVSVRCSVHRAPASGQYVSSRRMAPARR